MSLSVHNMFRDIARRYDLANDVLSFGIHRLWRRRAIRYLQAPLDARVLDLCTGTGDLAFSVADALGNRGSVVGLDFVAAMLEGAEKKQRLRKGAPRVSFLQGDMLSLPFPNSSFDAVTCAYGIRNVDDPGLGLQEARRVLKDGGTLLILEFGQPALPGFSHLYRMYSTYVMPIIGGLITGRRSAYEYLPETASVFPSGRRFAALIESAGFENVGFKTLSGGIAFLYRATAARVESEREPLRQAATG